MCEKCVNTHKCAYKPLFCESHKTSYDVEDSLVNSSKSNLIMTLLKDGFKLSFGSVLFYFMFNLSPVLVGYNLFCHEKENLL